MENKILFAHKGNYRWELIHDIDNSANNSPFEFESEVIISTKTSLHNFVSNTTELNAGYSFTKESKLTLEDKPTPDTSVKDESSVKHTAHIDITRKMVNECSSKFDQDITTTKKTKLTVGPQSISKLYQLVYYAPGVYSRLDTFVTEPKPDVQVHLSFSAEDCLSGLDGLLNIFSHTYPGEHNKVEWRHIRDSIVEISDEKDQILQFNNIVKVLSHINPGKSNKREWEAIRKTCNEILDKTKNAKNINDYIGSYNKLLTRLSATKPERDNKKEWQKISDYCSGILNWRSALVNTGDNLKCDVEPRKTVVPSSSSAEA